MKIKDIMTRNIATCPSTATAAEAARLMWEHDCGVIPVTDAETGRLCGVVTDRDACMASLTQDLPLSQIPVTRCMAAVVHSCREDQDVTSAEQLMQQHQVRRIPVVDGDRRPIGMLSLNDLALRAGNDRSAESKNLVKGVTDTLRAICAHPSGGAAAGAQRGAAAEA